MNAVVGCRNGRALCHEKGEERTCCLLEMKFTYLYVHLHLFSVCRVLMYKLLYSDSFLYSRLIGVIYKRNKVQNRFIVTLVLWSSS
jgi:hypothetical protein